MQLHLIIGLLSFLSLSAVVSSPLKTVQDIDSKSATDKPCKKSLAFEKDRLTGVVKVYNPGAKGYSDTYERLMRQKYNIKIIYNNMFTCTVEQTCYNSFSIPYLKQKYGDSIFLQTMIEANKMDRNGLGDRRAKMSKQTDSLIQNYFYKNVNPELYSPYYYTFGDRKETVVQCVLNADSTGSVYDLYESSLPDKPIDGELKRLAATIPYLITPALDNGSPANGSVSFVLRFSPKTAEMYEAP